MDELTDFETEANTILRSFFQYGNYATEKYYTPRLRKWESLNQFQKDLMPWFPEHLKAIKNGIESNSFFYKQLVAVATQGDIAKIFEAAPPTEEQLDKTVSLLSQITREWAKDCVDERQLLLKRVKERLNKSYPIKTTDRSKVVIKNPGCGLGRFTAEMALEGFNSIGIENSFHMVAVSNFIMNGTIPIEGLSIYPYIHGFSHWKERQAQVKVIKIPDINNLDDFKGRLILSIDFGSFVSDMGADRNIQISQDYSSSPDDVYNRLIHKSSTDVIVTDFFIDTAVNILNYIQTIYYNLKPGGQWINFGPLLYHFENDTKKETAIDFDWEKKETIKIQNDVPLQGLELAADDIVSICVDKVGFELIEYESDILSGYGSPQGPNGLPGYKCHYWVMKKK